MIPFPLAINRWLNRTKSVVLSLYYINQYRRAEADVKYYSQQYVHAFSDQKSHYLAEIVAAVHRRKTARENFLKEVDRVH